MKTVLKGLKIVDIRQISGEECFVTIEFKQSLPSLESWVELTIPLDNRKMSEECYEFFKLGSNDDWCILETDERLGSGYRAINITSGGNYWTVRPSGYERTKISAD